jgi:phosphate transport system substrate-binding protein
MFCLLGSGAFAQAAAAEEVIVSGSTTVLPVMQVAGEAFMAANPDVTLSISGGGSGNGIKALNEGLCAVAMSSRDIKESELAEGKANGINATRFAIAVDALLPIVNPENPIRDLSAQQLRDIYSGKISNWKELGGKDENIVVISRDTSSGTYETWAELIMKGEKIQARALLQTSNGAVSQIVSTNSKAIGYIGLGYLNDSIVALTMEGKVGNAETALNKSWPLSRELYVFTNGEPKDGVKKLIDYLLDPRKGQKAVLESGYVPISK